jgi:3',5'-cyclic AMP phosphodiesterase CpdA
VRLAHCSDLHLLSLTGARLLDFANKRWIGGLNLLANRGRHHRSEIFEAMIEDLNQGTADHLVVTGDLTNLALPDEFRFARQLFDQLALGSANVSVIPGNHDAYVASGMHDFTEHFAPYFASDPEWRWGVDRAAEPRSSHGHSRSDRRSDVLSDPWPTVRIRGPVVIIGLSTSHQTPWFTAYGRLGATQLERLRQVLADPRLANLCRVIAIHHPPAGGTSHSVVRGLRDRDALAAILAETGAELILHGHEHKDLAGNIAGPGGAKIPVRGIQSGTYEAGRIALRARYRVYDIEQVAGSRSTLVGEGLRVFHPDSGDFVTEPASVDLAAAG